MAPTQRGKKRDVTVGVKVNANLIYVFTTKNLSGIPGVSDADLVGQLGHIAATALGANALPKVLGANAPSPPRVSKKLATAGTAGQGSVGTFCAYDKLGTARAAGWSLSKAGRGVAIRSTGKSVTAAVEIDGVIYCWPLNSTDHASYAESLGLKAPASITSEAEKNRCVTGATAPKPGRISLRLEGGSTFSSYCKPDAAPEGEWFGKSSPFLYGNATAPAGGGT